MMSARRRILGFAIAISCCLLALPQLVHCQSLPSQQTSGVLPMVECHVGADFWINGQPPGLVWPANLAAPDRHNKLVIWSSWCGDGGRTGTLVLGPFKAPAHFSMAVAGIPFDKGNVLKLVRVSDQAQIIVTHDTPGNRWEQVDLDLPPDWVGSEIQIIAVDTSTTPDGWLAITEPYTVGAHGGIYPLWKNRTAGLPWHHWIADILGPLGLIALCWGLVGVAGYSILRRFVRTEPYLAPILSAAVVALVGYITFWGYFLGPHAGLGTVLMVFGLAGACFAYCVAKKVSLLPATDWKELGYAVPLLGIAGLFYLGVLWFPRVEGTPMEVMASRRPVIWSLPSDNVLQKWLAIALHDGKDPRSMNSPTWYSSDRPPLPAGLQLLTAPLIDDFFNAPFEQNSGLSGMLLQLTWVCGLWALLRSFGCSPRATAQIVLCLIPTALLYINSTFVWAKLSAAAFAIGMTVILCFRGKRPLTLPEAAVAGALFSLGMLCHSGTFFYDLPVLGLWFILPGRIGGPRWGATIVLVVVAGALLLPWMCYQKFYDPPGNHLLKLSFAGVIDADSIPLSKTIRTAYGALSKQTILEYKAQNFAMIFKAGSGNNASILHGWSTLFQLFPTDRGETRFQNFFYLFRTCGVFLLGFLALPVLLLRRDRDKLGPVLILFAALAMSVIIWCVLMFGPASTAMHQGAYGVPLVLLALLAYLLRLCHPMALLLVGAYNLVQFLWIYTWVFPYPPRIDGLAVGAIVLAMLGAVAVLLAGVGRRTARVVLLHADAVS